MYANAFASTHDEEHFGGDGVPSRDCLSERCNLAKRYWIELQVCFVRLASLLTRATDGRVWLKYSVSDCQRRMHSLCSSGFDTRSSCALFTTPSCSFKINLSLFPTICAHWLWAELNPHTPEAHLSRVGLSCSDLSTQSKLATLRRGFISVR